MCESKGSEKKRRAANNEYNKAKWQHTNTKYFDFMLSLAFVSLDILHDCTPTTSKCVFACPLACVWVCAKSVVDCALYCCLTDSQVLFILVSVFVYKQSPFLIGIFIFIYLFRRFCHAVLLCHGWHWCYYTVHWCCWRCCYCCCFFSLRPNDKWLFSFNCRLAKSLGAVVHFFLFFSRIYFIIYGVGIKQYVFVIKM